MLLLLADSGNPGFDVLMGGSETMHVATLVGLLLVAAFRQGLRVPPWVAVPFLVYGAILVAQGLSFEFLPYITVMGFMVRLAIAGAVCVLVPRFSLVFVRAMGILCALSLVFWILGFVEPWRALVCAYGLHDNSTAVYPRLGLLVHTYISGPEGFGARNSGMFWEPGALAGYLNLALILLVCQRRMLPHRTYLRYLALFTAEVLSTLSTAGYVGLLGAYGVGGLTVEECDGIGLYVSQGGHVTLDGCTVRHCGAEGVSVKDTFNVTVQGCTIRQVASHGVRVVADTGALHALKASNHVVTGNTIHDVGTSRKQACGVYMNNTVASTASWNHLYHLPHIAVQFNGNDNVVAYNRTASVNRETEDTGVIYMGGRSWVQRGNSIHHNYLDGSGGYGYSGGAWRTGLYSYGIYLDDFMSGTRIYRNTIRGASSAAIFIHSGRDNHLENNTIVEPAAGPLIIFNAWSNTNSWLDSMWTELQACKSNQSGWSGTEYYRRYPELNTITQAHPAQQDLMAYNSFTDNVIIYPRSAKSLYALGDLSRATSTFDRNAIWPGTNPITLSGRDGYTWSSWLSAGFDKNSRNIATAFGTAPQDYLLLTNTETTVKSYDLGSQVYRNVDGTSVSGSVTLPPFESKVLLIHSGYSLIVTATNGSVTRTPNQTSYTSGETVMLQAVPNTGYTFSGWSGDLSGTANPTTITMTGNKSVTANFTPSAVTYTLAATFGHTRPYCVSLLDGQGQCRGGLALFLVRSWLTGRRLVSIPFTFYADPMVDSPEEFAGLFPRVLELSEQEKASYIEIKTFTSAARLASAGLMTPVYYHRTYYLDLAQGLEALWQGFHRTCVKQKIRRAERNGITTRDARTEEEVALFCRLLAQDRRRLGLPPHRPAYFQNIWRGLVPLGLARFSLAYLREECVGGLCTFSFRETTFLAYIATEDSLRCDGVGQCLMWNAIRAAAQDHRKIVDLGKASPQAHGLIRFKENWGSTRLETPVFYFPRAMGVSSYDDEQRLAYRAMRWFWRTVPPRWSGVPSRFLYRHLG